MQARTFNSKMCTCRVSAFKAHMIHKQRKRADVLSRNLQRLKAISLYPPLNTTNLSNTVFLNEKRKKHTFKLEQQMGPFPLLAVSGQHWEQEPYRNVPLARPSPRSRLRWLCSPSRGGFDRDDSWARAPVQGCGCYEQEEKQSRPFLGPI